MRKRQGKVEQFRQASANAQPNLRPLTPPPTRAQNWRPQQLTWRPIAGLMAATAGLLLVAGWWLPVFGPNLPTVVLAPAAVLVGAAMWLLQPPFPTQRWFVASVAGCGLLVVLSVFGARDQVVIDGVVYPVSSDQARSHELVEELYDDLQNMGQLDTLLALSTPDARARFSQYEPARRDLEDLARKWSNYNLAGVPDPDFIEIIELVKIAATFGAESMQTKFGLLTQPSQQAEVSLLETRTAFSSAVLEAGAKLRPLGTRYVVDLVVVTE